MLFSESIDCNFQLYLILILSLLIVLLLAAALLAETHRRRLLKNTKTLNEANASLQHSVVEYQHFGWLSINMRWLSINMRWSILKNSFDKFIRIAKDHPNNTIDDGILFIESRCKYGSFKLDISDIYVARSLFLYGEWMEDEILLMGRVLRAGDGVIDVGANIGTHTIPFAKFVGPEGRVLAFEPQPRIVQTLIDNVKMNGLNNVEVIPKVVCENDESYFYVNQEDKEALRGNQAGLSFYGREKSDGNISSVCLDEFIYLNPRLIKIDAEGMERNVLKGARKLIITVRPILYVENHEQDFSAALLHELFNLNYDCYWHLVLAYNPDNYMGMKYDIWNGRGFNINMLCLPKEKIYP